MFRVGNLHHDLAERTRGSPPALHDAPANLLYMAITRSRKLWCWWHTEGLGIAVKNMDAAGGCAG